MPSKVNISPISVLNSNIQDKIQNYVNYLYIKENIENIEEQQNILKLQVEQLEMNLIKNKNKIKENEDKIKPFEKDLSKSKFWPLSYKVV